MTKAADTSGERPAVDGNFVLVWVEPKLIAFAMPGGRKSLLALVRSSAALIRCAAEMRHREQTEVKRLSKQRIREVGAELLVAAAQQMVVLNQAQERIADVVVQITDDSNIDMFLSPMVTRGELERAAVFVLRSAYSGCRTSGTVLSVTEFQQWVEQLACETFSKPLTTPPTAGDVQA